MDKENNSTKCLPCSECSFSQVAIVECNSTQNRECVCPPGKFFDEDLLFCKKCSKCPVGEGVVAECTSTNDTKCQPCSKGTFSDEKSLEQKCKRCSKCRASRNKVLKENCNAFRDTICRKTTTSQPTVNATSQSSIFDSSKTTPPNKEEEPQGVVKRTKRSTSAQSVYLILGITFVSLIPAAIISVALFFAMKRRREYGKNANYPPEEKGIRKYHLSIPMTPVSATPILGRYSQYENSKNKMLVRDLPGNVIIELGRLLNPKSYNNWAKLAGRLGFTNNHAKNFELEPEEATQSLLSEWSQQDGSTVDVLVRILKEMKRDDCVQVLQENNNKTCKKHTSCIPSPADE
ncbi:tumor necrosis factor receptor superfamily member 16-like isoform X2 [Porites lutea]